MYIAYIHNVNSSQNSGRLFSSSLRILENVGHPHLPWVLEGEHVDDVSDINSQVVADVEYS